MVTGLKVKEKPVSIRNVHNFFLPKHGSEAQCFFFFRSSRWPTAVESYFWLVTRHFLILRIASSDISSSIVVLVGQQLFTAQGFSYFDPLDGPILLRVIFWQLTCHFLILRISSSDIHCMRSAVFGAILVRIFPHLDWIQRDTSYLSVLSPNPGKCGPE